MHHFSCFLRHRASVVLACALVAKCFLPVAALASETDGTIAAPDGYAWGERLGWINFGLAQGGVHVRDDGLTGYAWGDAAGWINLDPSPSARVTNDGEGTLGGYAWNEHIGWIAFSGVTIGPDGAFLGQATALVDGGRISFNCANTNSCASSGFRVMTDWRPASARAESAPPIPSGGGSPSSPSASPEGAGSGEVTPPNITDDIIAFNTMMVEWGSDQCGVRADMNGDCRVDILDFNLLMVRWGLFSPI